MGLSQRPPSAAYRQADIAGRVTQSRRGRCVGPPAGGGGWRAGGGGPPRGLWGADVLAGVVAAEAAGREQRNEHGISRVPPAALPASFRPGGPSRPFRGGESGLHAEGLSRPIPSAPDRLGGVGRSCVRPGPARGRSGGVCRETSRRPCPCPGRWRTGGASPRGRITPTVLGGKPVQWGPRSVQRYRLEFLDCSRRAPHVEGATLHLPRVLV